MYGERLKTEENMRDEKVQGVEQKKDEDEDEDNFSNDE